MRLYPKISEMARYLKLRFASDAYERKRAVEIPDELAAKWAKADDAVREAQDALYSYLDTQKVKIDVSGAR